MAAARSAVNRAPAVVGGDLVNASVASAVSIRTASCDAEVTEERHEFGR